jgi:hypothetical protein
MDPALVIQAQAGDEAAFAQLTQLVSGRLNRVAFSIPASWASVSAARGASGRTEARNESDMRRARRSDRSQWLYARNDPWQGPKLGDMDADGDIDIADLDVISVVLVAAASVEPGDPTRDKALDLNADRVIDTVDLWILDALIEARGAG